MNNLFDAIPEHLDKELFDTLVHNDAVQVERIVSRGHRSPERGWYDQARNEWLVPLRINPTGRFLQATLHWKSTDPVAGNRSTDTENWRGGASMFGKMARCVACKSRSEIDQPRARPCAR